MKLLVSFLLVCTLLCSVNGYWESGHMLVAEIAKYLLNDTGNATT